MDDVDTRLRGAPALPVDPAQLAAVGLDQRGLVTRAQCLSAGLTAKAIEVRLARGTWKHLHRGVYLTVPGRDDWWTTATAAHLACGSSAAWSHDTAAYVWGLVARPAQTIDVLVDDSRRIAQPAGVQLHRSVHADRRCDQLVWPWRTTVEETILDLSAVGTADETFALLGRAFQRHLTGEATMLARLAERHSHRHRADIVAALSDVVAGAESAMEIRYVRDVERAHGLPRGRRQSVTEPSAGRLRLRDVTYDAQRAIVELDGRLGHDQAADRVSDGRRDRDGAASGWLTVRAFWPEVAGSPCGLAVDVGAVLNVRGWPGRPRQCRRRECVVPRS
ncbi:MAG: hypothetical protein M3Y06_07640 [Actinomycetota bacterium]|nr:hypothetical protein [Actinomycetota bacterium]